MTYPEALAFLESFVNYEKKDNYNYKTSFKLDRMRRLAERPANVLFILRNLFKE